MQNITSATDLKNAILLLEVEQVVNRQQLEKQFHVTFESFKPVNLLRNSLKDIASSPHLIDNILGATIGIATGYVSKKIVVGASHNLFRKVMGSVLQLGVTDLVAQHPEAIKSLGQFIGQHIFRKKKHEHNEQGE